MISIKGNKSGTAGFHIATVLWAPKAVRPDTLLQSAALGFRLAPIEMKADVTESEVILFSSMAVSD